MSLTGSDPVMGLATSEGDGFGNEVGILPARRVTLPR